MPCTGSALIHLTRSAPKKHKKKSKKEAEPEAEDADEIEDEGLRC